MHPLDPPNLSFSLIYTYVYIYMQGYHSILPHSPLFELLSWHTVVAKTMPFISMSPAQPRILKHNSYWKMLKECISNMNHKEDNLWAYYACLPMYKGLTWKREKRLYCCFRMRTSDKSFKTWFDSNISESISHSQCCQGVELACTPGSSGKTKLRLRHRWWWRRSYLPRKLL